MSPMGYKILEIKRNRAALHAKSEAEAAWGLTLQLNRLVRSGL